MKNLFFAVIAVSCILSACDSPLVPAPFIPGGDAESRSIGAPGNITATHGGKGSIELRWDDVSGAVRYNIYKANSPLESFVQCAETTSNQFKFTVTAGSTVYYRVSSVAYNGGESAHSFYVMGSSLAQPFITDITDITEASATVTWYMENATDATYKNNLLYTVYCFEGSTEVAQLALNGADLAENKASFGSLKPNARYEYQVEAYLRGDQSNSEKSIRVDAVTARRMRPAAPVNLRATCGTSKNAVELTFELPDMVDIALGDNKYDPKPVYFVVSRRQYSGSGTNVYQSACSYFGSIADNAATKGGKTFNNNSYTPGLTVKWTDENVSRGVEYEYQVQSYVDDPSKNISADSSKASSVGWALSEGILSFGDIHYEFNESGLLYVSAELPLVFDFDPKGETYDYVLVETIEPIDGEHPNDPSDIVERTSDTLTYNDITNYVAQMDLTQQTTAETPGRGVYSYKVEIKLNGETGEPIATVKTIGQVEVSENTDPIIVEGFSVQDGYTDKFVFKWHYHENRRYVLYASDDGEDWSTEIAEVNPDPDDSSTVKDENYSYTYTAQEPGLTKYFAIRPYRVIDDTPKPGQRVYAPAASRTLGVPELSLSGDAAYSVITVAWTEAQKADTYRIQYWYVDEGMGTAKPAATVKRSDLSRDASERFIYSFMPFEGNTLDAAKAGKEIQVVVDALNEDLRVKAGVGEIFTKSEVVQTRLVGPALLNPSASHAASPTEIDVSWSGVSGATGYYVFRRQFNMTNTTEEKEAIVYYVPKVSADTTSITITGKGLNSSSGTKEDTHTVKAAASFANSRYTLKDLYLSYSEYNSVYSNHVPVYREQQNDMAQGFSYRYYIVPVVDRSGSPEPLTSINFAYSGANISYYTIQENGVNIRYNGAAAFEKNGFTIGFGQNVTATKGTYAVQNSNTNSGIQVTWNAPHLAGTGITPAYEVYRKAYDTGTWVKIITVNTPTYIDSSASITKGIAYEYLIGISNGSFASEPSASTRFIESCRAAKDEKGRPNMLGYMLDMVRMESVSRNEQKVGNDFAEEVKWFSAGVKNAFSTDNNWGIDGYTVFVMNRNIDGGWHEIADISSNLPNQTNQSVKVAANTKFVDDRDLLRVMRDYRHYFKVRSYVLHNSEKVYCPDPDWNYETLFVANRTNQETSNFLETDYVKWGARQISVEEFARIATLPVAWGIHHMRGGSRWNWVVHGYGEKTLNGNNGSSGTVSSEATYSASRWWWNFYNYKPSMDTRANKHPNGFQSGFYGASNGGWTWQYAVIFLTINTGSKDGRSMIYAGAPTTSNFPDRYGARDNYGVDPFDIIGPPNVNGMYTGKMRFDNFQLNSDSQTAGSMRVRYPASAAEVTGVGQYNVALPYVVYQSRDPAIRFEYDEWF